MKSIFLDVDGVLNCATTERRLVSDPVFPFVDTRKVLRLREILEKTGAILVLSSSWREGAFAHASFSDRQAYLELRAEFKRLRCPLWIDCTPIMSGSREEEIKKWLERHPEVTDFVILDDVGIEFDRLKDHLVLTNWQTGLDKVAANKVIELLNKEEERK